MSAAPVINKNFLSSPLSPLFAVNTIKTMLDKRKIILGIAIKKSLWIQ